jgi:SAM-dependent methyltransferase
MTDTMTLAAAAGTPSQAAGGAILSVIIVNYNSQSFLRLGLKSLFFLTRNPHRVYICDNGSSDEDFRRLRFYCSFFPNVTLIARNQTGPGSMGHGEALNILAGFIDTPYAAVMDADCLPLMLHWDQFLIDQLDDVTKIAGTPMAANSPNNKKPTDFPLMFLCLFETKAFRKLAIDFRPKDISRQQDTGWELREKFLKSGLAGKNLVGENTRTYKSGPFKENICDEYYTDASHSRLICSHLGRGSAPNSSKYARSRRQGVKAYEKDKAAWLKTCEVIIDREIRASASAPDSRIEVVACDLCGPGPATKTLTALDLHNNLPGVWDVVRCDRCGLAFTNPRPNPAHIGEFYPDNYPCYRPSGPAEIPAAPPAGMKGFKRRLRAQAMRQHLGYHSESIPASLFWKVITFPLKRSLDVSLVPRFPKDAKPPRLLEIGCGVGSRLLEMKELGWDVCGIEPSDLAASHARAAGLDVKTSLLEEAEFPAVRFDCIVLNMVLEHLHSPKAGLAMIGAWLKPGGEILISVPDFDGVEARLYGQYHYGLQVPTHLYHFTPATLAPFLAGYSFKVVHQGFHRDLKSGLEYYLRENPGSVFRHFFRIPNKAYTVTARILALMNKTSRMQIRAVKAQAT